MNKFSITTFFLAIFWYSAGIFAQSDSTSSFADYLFSEGEYYRAITEYQRILYTSNDPVSVEFYRKKIALCYYHGGEYEQFIAEVNRFRPLFYRNPETMDQLNFLTVRSYFNLGQYTKVLSASSIIKLNEDIEKHEAIALMRGIAYAKTNEPELASDALQTIRHNTTYISFREDYQQAQPEISGIRKNPYIAGTLSAILPGAGYIYAGRISTGIGSFLLNGVLIWALTDAVKNKQFGISAAIGAFGSGWYFGNISGSYDAAEKYSAIEANQYIDKLLEKNNLTEYKAP